MEECFLLVGLAFYMLLSELEFSSIAGVDEKQKQEKFFFHGKGNAKYTPMDVSRKEISSDSEGGPRSIRVCRLPALHVQIWAMKF